MSHMSHVCKDHFTRGSNLILESPLVHICDLKLSTIELISHNKFNKLDRITHPSSFPIIRDLWRRRIFKNQTLILNANMKRLSPNCFEHIVRLNSHFHCDVRVPPRTLLSEKETRRKDRLRILKQSLVVFNNLALFLETKWSFLPSIFDFLRVSIEKSIAKLNNRWLFTEMRWDRNISLNTLLIFNCLWLVLFATILDFLNMWYLNFCLSFVASCNLNMALKQICAGLWRWWQSILSISTKKRKKKEEFSPYKWCHWLVVFFKHGGCAKDSNKQRQPPVRSKAYNHQVKKCKRCVK